MSPATARSQASIDAAQPLMVVDHTGDRDQPRDANERSSATSTPRSSTTHCGRRAHATSRVVHRTRVGVQRVASANSALPRVVTAHSRRPRYHPAQAAACGVVVAARTCSTRSRSSSRGPAESPSPLGCARRYRAVVLGNLVDNTCAVGHAGLRADECRLGQRAASLRSSPADARPRGPGGSPPDARGCVRAELG